MLVYQAIAIEKWSQERPILQMMKEALERAFSLEKDIMAKKRGKGSEVLQKLQRIIKLSNQLNGGCRVTI